MRITTVLRQNVTELVVVRVTLLICEVKMKTLLKKLIYRKNKYNTSIERWAQVEYGKDWRWAYQFILDKGKPPVKGVNY